MVAVAEDNAGGEAGIDGGSLYKIVNQRDFSGFYRLLQEGKGLTHERLVVGAECGLGLADLRED